jgi:glycosyltransferase involved in cell wall biosynthesis
MIEPQVSIVICTHCRVDLLGSAVQSLVEQSASPDCYEVIVVDNDFGRTTSVQKIVDWAREHICCVYAHEARIGLSSARNAGGRLARAAYVSYFDDDAKALPDYVGRLTGILAAHKPDICGGPFYPFYTEPKPDWFLDSYGSGAFHGDRARWLESREYLSGSNITFKRELLEDLGWFDLSLGMKGNAPGGGEETKVMIEAWNKYPKLRVFYDPDLFVYHFVPARKFSVWYRLYRDYATGKDQAYLWLPEEGQHAARARAPFDLARSVPKLVAKSLIETSARDRQRYPYWQNYVYEKISKYMITIGEKVRLTQDLFSSNRKGYRSGVWK